MGNKQGKLEDRERKNSKKNKKTKRSASVHEIPDTRNDQGAGNATSPFARDFRGNTRPGLKKYQSYAGPSGNGTNTPQSEDHSELKLYRQSASAGPTGGRYRSLQRNTGPSAGTMSRSRSVTSSIYQSNGTLNREPVNNNNEHATYKRYSQIPASAHYPTLNDTRDSIRSSVTALNATYSGPNTSFREVTNYRVVADDFPDTESIKRRLAQFETQFANCFTALYSRLSETVQLAAVSIALCLGPNGRHQISLYQYLTSNEIPVDLNDLQQTGPPNREQYVLTIAESLFHGVKHVRSQRIPDRRQWVSLAKELVTCLAVEVADELSRIFEYQIALLGDGLPIDLLARHAVECALEYLKTGNRFLERNTLIAGVLSGTPRAADSAASRVISVVIGDREFKWNLSQIFKRCGLRKESLLFSPKSRDSTAFVPWTCCTSPDSNALVYGYRGIALDRDPVHGFYMTTRDDEVHFTQTAGWNPDDIHNRYNPFRRLIGKEVMDEYCSVTKGKENVTLADYVLKLQGYEYSRDTIQPIYRPLGMVSGLSKSSKVRSSASSLLSAGYGNNKTLSRRDEDVAARLHSQFPSVKQIQVTSTLLLQNPSASTPTTNGHSRPYYPRTGGKGYKSESCSIASGDFGYDRYERDIVPAGFGDSRFRNSSTFTRQEAVPQGRLYQSQRPHSSRSISNFNPGPTYNYLRTTSPGASHNYAPTTTPNHMSYGNPGVYPAQTVSRGSTMTGNGPPINQDSGFNQASTLNRGLTGVNQGQPNRRPTHLVREISAPVPTENRDFLDFNAFLGMVKQGENGEARSEIIPSGNSNGANGPYGMARYEAPSPFPSNEGVLSNALNRNGNSQLGNNGGDYNYRRTALSHV